MLSLFYRTWADAQPTVQFDRPESDRFAAYVGSLAGVGLPSLQDRDAMPDLAKLSFAGRLRLPVAARRGPAGDPGRVLRAADAARRVRRPVAAAAG